MTIATIMTKEVLTVAPTTPFADIQQIFREVPFHHLLVQENGKLKGVISDRDLMTQISHYTDKNTGETFEDFLPRLTAADVMTSETVVIDSENTIDAGAILLLEHNFSCLPVVDADYTIEGIITWKDLLKYYVYR